MLSRNQFTILNAVVKHASGEKKMSIREIAKATSLSVGTVASTLKTLKASPCDAIDESNRITEAGMRLLSPYRVKNAVIMAAGLSTRFAPISYERPKGLLTIRGEVLIERQIRQLREAGIEEIYVVLGYKKEEFFYLEDKFGVSFRINEEFLIRNNNSTIKCVEDILDNTYICSSDDYFVCNPFEQYVYESYYAAIFIEGATTEYCFEIEGKDDKVRSVHVGGNDSWIMMGHAYWDRSFSMKFKAILNDVYCDSATAAKLWEDIYLDHLSDLPMVVRKYPAGCIWEFDSLDEVAEFDPHFIQNVDSAILDNICNVLHCGREDISGILPIKQGATNLSFRFDVDGCSYVYRHPGEGTEEIINREAETYSECVALSLGLDRTFIYEDGAAGWKISRFVDGSKNLDNHDKEQVERALAMAYALHTSGVVSPWYFDLYDEACKILRLLDERSWVAFEGFSRLLEMAAVLHDMVEYDEVEKCLCHNNLYDSNFLVSNEGIDLIDWEYSGMGDYGNDLGTFVCCSDYGYDEATSVYATYFGRKPTAAELRHCVASTALASFYWFVWALYKEACGEPMGEWLYRWYKHFAVFGKKALELNAVRKDTGRGALK